MIGVTETGAAELLEPLQANVGLLRERWADKTLADIYGEKPLTEHVEAADGLVELVTLDAINGEYDGTDIVLGLPYLQGFTAHHYIRARTMQELVAPNSRLTVLPAEADSVVLAAEEIKRLGLFRGRTIAEHQMKALEARGLGKTAMTGYSWGGLSVLELVSLGSDRLEVVGVNADEVPHEMGRNVAKLKRDFMRSGGFLELRRAVSDAHILALSEVMSPPRLAFDLARFAIRSQGKNAKLLAKAMTGTHSDAILSAVSQLGHNRVKIGLVEGSRIFNLQDLGLADIVLSEAPRVASYVGNGFYAHASADNVILHAGMVKDGLTPYIKD